jgi:hypothetical protein
VTCREYTSWQRASDVVCVVYILLSIDIINGAKILRQYIYLIQTIIIYKTGLDIFPVIC